MSPTAESLSQQAHRRLIGILGLLLPLLLFIFAGLRHTVGLPAWTPLNSISAYYYTGAVAIFVGVLFALALFLLTYPGYKGVIADRLLGLVGGTAAILVALFPTSAPDGLSTDLVEPVHANGPLSLGRGPVRRVHPLCDLAVPEVQHPAPRRPAAGKAPPR